AGRQPGRLPGAGRGSDDGLQRARRGPRSRPDRRAERGRARAPHGAGAGQGRALAPGREADDRRSGAQHKYVPGIPPVAWRREAMGPAELIMILFGLFVGVMVIAGIVSRFITTVPAGLIRIVSW